MYIYIYISAAGALSLIMNRRYLTTDTIESAHARWQTAELARAAKPRTLLKIGIVGRRYFDYHTSAHVCRNVGRPTLQTTAIDRHY